MPSRHRKRFKFEPEYLTRVRAVPNHACQLPFEEDPVQFHVTDGKFVHLRRSVKRLFLVDYKNPNAKFLFRSGACIYTEMHRHMQHYYYMIHPFSKFRNYWENVMIFVLILVYMTLSFELSKVAAFNAIAYAKLTLDIFCMVDVLLCFVTGYYDKEKQIIILQWSSVCWHYVKTYFVFDLMSSLPWSAIIVFGNLPQLYHMKLFMMLKLLRFPTLFHYIQNACDRHHWNFHKHGTTFKLSLICIGTSSSAFFLMITQLNKRTPAQAQAWSDNVSNIDRACFAYGRQLLLVGIGSNIESHDYADMICSIVCLICGSILNMVLLAKMMTLYARSVSTQAKYKALMQQISEYMKYKELSYNLRDRITRYVNFKYRKHIFKEADIMKNVSSILRQDLMLNNCQTMIQRVDFFKELPISAMLSLLSRLKSDVYLPNDVIVHAGVHGNAMYFIYNGTVAVYTMTGKEICHLSEGNHFGEIALLINEPRVATVVAIKECELFKLSRKDFHAALEPFPELAAKIRESAMVRLETTMKMMQEDTLGSLMLLPRASVMGTTESSMDLSVEGSFWSHSTM